MSNKIEHESNIKLVFILIGIAFIMGILTGTLISKDKKNTDEAVLIEETKVVGGTEQTLIEKVSVETEVFKETVTYPNETDEVKVESQIVSDEQVEKVELVSYEIDTDYCKLYFPEIWKEQIEVKYLEEFGYKVQFYGVIEGKDSVHLFDICFNSDDGEMLGYFENGENVINVSVDVMELSFDDSWKQEEIDQIYSMQEEMNYVVSSLTKNDNYVEP